jgi:RHS repeat-associated protein
LAHVSLPVGGGAIRGIGEKFAVNPATGSGSFTIPVPVSPGRAGFGPKLDLSYDSASGNGPFGFGWHINLPAITRKTDKGLPRYCDSDESDVFLISGAEDLVPVLDAAGNRVHTTRTVFQTTYDIYPYRPRIDSLFARIERWVDQTGASHWRSISRENVTTLYGFDDGSRVADHDNPTHIFSWQICRTWDDKGNVTVYHYIPENDDGIATAAANEANRTTDTRKIQCYLKYITYGNLEPYFPHWTAQGNPTPLPADWVFQLVVDYGDHSAAAPTPAPDLTWPVRPDAFSTRRAGFEVRTYRRVSRLLFFHNFPNETNCGADYLARSLDFAYFDQESPLDPRNPCYTFLTSITQAAYRRNGNAYLRDSLPPLEMEYSQPEIQPQALPLDPDSAANLPEGLDGATFQWVDLDGEGLSGILSDSGGGWAYKRNRSAVNQVPRGDGTAIAQASFGPLESVAVLPAYSNLEGRQLLDLSGGGRLNVVDFSGVQPGFFKRTTDASWEPFRAFTSLPQVDWANPNLKFIDLTGDGLADILLTEDALFTFHESLGEAGFAAASVVRTPWDEEAGPKIVLSDGSETIFLADMTGDGLSDLVRIRNGEVSYWPNLGYGRFGRKVSMDHAPRFVDEERFDPRRIRLADIDGSGTADILYLSADGVEVAFNQSGNAWADLVSIAIFPSADNPGAIQVLDLLGTGTSCLVWSSPLPNAAGAPLLYVDLMGGRKPHLLERIANNLGAETRLVYAPSTRFYLADREAGTPWITRLPQPVQVVARVETIDWIGRSRLVTRYAYHHGYFDGIEREFRGFGMVEQWDTEEYRADEAFDDGDFVNWDVSSWSPPVHTRTWFHTGAFEEAAAVSRQFAGEYWVEPALRPDNRADDRAAMELPDTAVPSGLNAFEIREAYRALKGQLLRSEVFADDGAASALNPFTVAEHNFTIQMLQPAGGNRHAVFTVTPRETLSFDYERNPSDPRVTHDLNLNVDRYGNILSTVNVAYARRSGSPAPEPNLPAAAQGMLAYDQSRLHIAAIEHQFTTDAATDPAQWPDAYRTPMPAGNITAEITGIAPQSARSGITNLFSFAELTGIWQTAWSGSNDIPYEQFPAADLDGSGSPAASLTRRIVGISRTQYRSDDLSTLLAFEDIQPTARPGETYTSAFTPGLLASIFGNLVAATDLTEGGYVQLAGLAGWWAPSGRVYYSPGDSDTTVQELTAAKAHFFQPRRAVDAFGGIQRISYDGYDLLAASSTDAVGNVTAAANDYRVMLPAVVTDPNGNQTATAFNCLGLVTATAVMGKTTESLGDTLTGFTADLDQPSLLAALASPQADPSALLGNATTRTLYDVSAFYRTRNLPAPAPPALYAIARETHAADLAPGQVTRYQHTLSYSDGFGRAIQQKLLADPGPLTEGGPDVSPRWIGSGWAILDNKGKTVRRYEPFFTSTPGFEFALQNGVSSVFLYDAPGRLVATLHPDNTWEKVIFTPWRSEVWDSNDTVLIADPRTDPDTGAHFTRLLGSAPGAFTSWYSARIGGTFGATPAEQAANLDAAQKTSAHAGTPGVTHFDPLSGASLTVVDNGAAGRYGSRIALDATRKPLAVFDALGRRVKEYALRAPLAGGGFQYVAGFDLQGHGIYQNGMDTGPRRTLTDIAGLPIRFWDDRGNAFRILYDHNRRTTHRYVATNGATEILLERLVYGEGLPAANLCGKLFRHYDSAGSSLTAQFDFKGNPLSTTRQFAIDYRHSVNWKPLADLTAAADLDAASAPLLRPADRFDGSTSYDALNRPIQIVTPHSAAMHPNVLRPAYNQSNRIHHVDAWLQQSTAPAALLDPATATTQPVAAIEYNARSQRSKLRLGNGTVSAYQFDPLTQRVATLTTTRPPSFPQDQLTVQDLAYFYDPSGNVTRIRDTADTQNVIYFQNQRVEPSSDYTYDSLYRLTQASGREHLGQNANALLTPQQVGNSDAFRAALPQPGDGNAMGNYTESFTYDPVGNILTLLHQVSSGAWTRRYAYAAPSRIDPLQTGDRLTSNSLPGDPAAGPYSAAYSYDPHGNMTAMPHLPTLGWDERDRVRSTTRQVAPTPETTYYVYEGGGQRIRKTTDAQQTAIRAAERLYLGPIEIYREFSDGETISLERQTLTVMAGSTPAAFVETRTAGTDAGLPQSTRYQYTNHLGSAVLELDDLAAIVSYEEYFAYGSTAYQAVRSQTETAKRYRYCGKERDTETDLYYYGARYYASWLGRWISADPAELSDGVNRYAYCRGNPIALHDADGMQSTLSSFDKAWVANIVVPILRTEVYTDKQGSHNISLEHRIMMAAQARAESTSMAQTDTGAYKDPEGFNVFNIQVNAGTPGSKTVKRAEYIVKLSKEDAAKADLEATEQVQSGSRKDTWKTYKKVGEDVFKLGNVSVGIPMYPSMEKAIQGYFQFQQARPGKKSYNALIDPSSAASDFYQGLKGFGTDPKYANAEKHIGPLTKDIIKLVQAYAKERLPQLDAEIKRNNEVLEGYLNDLAEHVKAKTLAETDEDKQAAQDDIDRDQDLINMVQGVIAPLEAERRALKEVAAMPAPQ